MRRFKSLRQSAVRQELAMRGLTFERFPAPRSHSLLKTQPRWRHVQTCNTTRCLGSAVKRRMWRLPALPDRFSHAWSKPALSQGPANLDVMPIDIPRLTSASTDRTQRDHLWNDWLEYFSHIESIENERTWLREKLQEDIEIENYDEARQTKKNLVALDEQDILSVVQHELSRAIEEERYDDAARIRDEGLAGLCGWWVVRGHDDPRGQLMYICKEFCRYSGRIFSPNEIATLCGVSESFMTEDIFAERAETSSDGHFAMEVFLRRDPNGSIQHQSCVLRSPELEALEEEGGGVVDDIEAEVYVKAAEDIPHEAIRVMVSIVQQDDQDGMDDDSKDASRPHPPSEPEDVEVAAVVVSDGSDSDDTVVVDEDKPDGDYAPFELQYRLPADLQWWDRNRFVLSVDEESAVEEKNEDEDEDDDDDEDEDEEDESEDASTDTTTATTDAESFDLEEHFTKALEKAIDDMPMSELKPHLKDRISFYSMSKKLYSLLEQVLKKIERQETELEDFPGWSKTGRDSESAELEGEVMFTRLPLEECTTTDPFAGLFIGRFGPHGLEVLHLSRQIDITNGKECVYVRKITGDSNVPAGELSFMARIDRGNRAVPEAMHSEELGIRFQYSGRGRIAQTGYKKPEWVDGELLVFDPSSPLAGGAELGLVWSIPQARRAHILLYRLTFPQME